MAKGGRAGYKSGMRVCKLAKRGKGRSLRKEFVMAKKGLRSWVKGKLGRYCKQAARWFLPEMWKKWWRKKKKYPKCVPIAKARAMSKGQRAGAVRKKKQAKANTGPTPSRAATFAKRKKAMDGGMINMTRMVNV